MTMSIVLEQLGIIDKLTQHNKHLINLFAQHMEVEAEEQKLVDILKENAKEGQDNGLDNRVLDTSALCCNPCSLGIYDQEA